MPSMFERAIAMESGAPHGNMANPFDVTSQWFVTAGQQPATPEFNAQQVCFYLGMQLEEMAEKLSLLASGTTFRHGFNSNDFTAELNYSAKIFKEASPKILGRIEAAVRANPALWLDADLDLMWVTLGAVRAMGVEPSAAYALVADANWAKFPGGVVTKDANGKVVKPPGWREADLTPVLPAVLRGGGE